MLSLRSGEIKIKEEDEAIFKAVAQSADLREKIRALIRDQNSSGKALLQSEEESLDSVSKSSEVSSEVSRQATYSGSESPKSPLIFSSGSPKSEMDLSQSSKQSSVSLISALETIFPDTAKEILLSYEVNNNLIKILVNKEQRPATGISGSHRAIM